MKKSEIVKILEENESKFLEKDIKNNYCEINYYTLINILEDYMEPKYKGNHQSTYDIAMGTRCEWDKE